MFNLVHILTGMRRSGKTFQPFQLITEYKKRWASAHADAHLECPYSSAEHGRNLSSQVLAQALQASEGNRLADDLHGLEQRRGDLAAGHGDAQRPEGQARRGL